MSQKIRSSIAFLISLAFVLVAIWGGYKGVQFVWRVLININPELAVAVIAAGATLVASTITVMLGRYYERKKEIEAHFRSEKIKIYDEFLTELFKVFENGGESTNETDAMVKFLRQWQRKLVLWGGSNVLATYFRWINHIKDNQDAQTIILMDEFFRALRSDIGQSSNGLTKGAFANLILRRGEFFLSEAQKNPKITLAELAELEKGKFGDNL